MPLTAVNGVRLQVNETGSGEPLVLVHGSWDDRRAWRLVDGNLAESFLVVSYDRRGHSDSDGADTEGTRRDDEDDLAALIETLGLAPAHLVANSFGGSISLSLAARRPDLVRSVAAHEPPLVSLLGEEAAAVGDGVGPVIELVEAGDREAAARTFVEDVALGPGAWQMMSAEERETMVRNAGTFVGEMRDAAWSEIDLAALGRLDRPVLLTQGDQSPPFFAMVIARLVEAAPRAEVRTLPGAGHVPHVTHPEEYVAAVSEFVRSAG